jgi:hypothetical protein
MNEVAEWAAGSGNGNRNEENLTKAIRLAKLG